MEFQHKCFCRLQQLRRSCWLCDQSDFKPQAEAGLTASSWAAGATSSMTPHNLPRSLALSLALISLSLSYCVFVPNRTVGFCFLYCCQHQNNTCYFTSITLFFGKFQVVDLFGIVMVEEKEAEKELSQSTFLTVCSSKTCRQIQTKTFPLIESKSGVTCYHQVV